MKAIHLFLWSIYGAFFCLLYPVALLFDILALPFILVAWLSGLAVDGLHGIGRATRRCQENVRKATKARYDLFKTKAPKARKSAESAMDDAIPSAS
jgi:hypothetical protein